jgi:hypothetical protein
MQEKRMHFVKSGGDPMRLFDQFFPGGQRLLNSKEWRGKGPRTCGITNAKSRSRPMNATGPVIFDIEVTYRPPGFISYVGRTKYDGWTCMMLDRNPDGTLLDGHGQPLKDGEAPVYLPFQAYKECDFNDLDFGEFIDETDVPGVTHVTYDDLMKGINERVHQLAHFSTRHSFAVPFRQRPLTKIAITDQPTKVVYDGFGTQIILFNKGTPHFKQMIYLRMVDLISDFLQGKIYIKSLPDGEGGVLINVTDSLIDISPNPTGTTRFDVLAEYLPDNFLDDVALQMQSVFLITVQVVDGKGGGLLVRPDSSHKQRD